MAFTGKNFDDNEYQKILKASTKQGSYMYDSPLPSACIATALPNGKHSNVAQNLIDTDSSIQDHRQSKKTQSMSQITDSAVFENTCDFGINASRITDPILETGRGRGYGDGLLFDAMPPNGVNLQDHSIEAFPREASTRLFSKDNL